jgi:hypothetical protein
MAQLHEKTETHGQALDGQRRGNLVLATHSSPENLGLGWHWHFLADFGWLLTGLVYVVMLFASPEWHRLIPASWH